MISDWSMEVSSSTVDAGPCLAGFARCVLVSPRAGLTSPSSSYGLVFFSQPHPVGMSRMADGVLYLMMIRSAYRSPLPFLPSSCTVPLIPLRNNPTPLTSLTPHPAPRLSRASLRWPYRTYLRFLFLFHPSSFQFGHDVIITSVWFLYVVQFPPPPPCRPGRHRLSYRSRARMPSSSSSQRFSCWIQEVCRPCLVLPMQSHKIPFERAGPF